MSWAPFSQFQFFTEHRESIYEGGGTGVYGSPHFQDSLSFNSIHPLPPVNTILPRDGCVNCQEQGCSENR